MALLDLIFSGGPPKLNSIGSIVIDATIRENHELSAEVTEHPVESGSTISDHIFNAPIRVLLEGEVTDSPVQLFNFSVGERRLEAYAQFLEIRKAREPVTLVTGLSVYSDMVMTSLSMPQEVGTGKRLQFTAEFQQIEVVETETTTLPPASIAEEKRDIASSTQDGGQQTAKEANAEQSATSSSALNDFFKGFGGAD